MSRYIGDKYNVSMVPEFLNDFANEIFAALEDEIEWSRPISTSRRTNATYGDPGVVYTVRFGGYGNRPLNISRRVAKPWTPLLAILRDLVSMKTGDKYNVCVVQRYPNGRVGINPHRDDEMGSNSIACLSFGAERCLVMKPPSYIREDEKRYNLSNGSLYVLEPPTNAHWQHSLPLDATTTPRISLTYRYI